jgi:hypothetical protein
MQTNPSPGREAAYPRSESSYRQLVRNILTAVAQVSDIDVRHQGYSVEAVRQNGGKQRRSCTQYVERCEITQS